MSLRGIRVLDVTHQIAGPWSTELLADLGADVIKVENPNGGDPARKYPYFGPAVFVTENRNKKSITLNLKSQKGRAIALELVSRCDIFVENFTPGLMEKLRLGYSDLREINPRLIYCSISGFGKVSPNRDRPAWDAALQAMSGLMTITGEPERPPMRVGTSIVDLTAGTYAVCGILLALLEREKSGLGRLVDISLFDSAASLVNYWGAHASITHTVPTRMGNTWPALAPYQVFQTKDGFVFIGASNDDFWKKLCEVLELNSLIVDSRFSTNERRVKNMAILAQLVDETTRKWENEKLIAELHRVEVPCAPVNTVDKMINDESLAHRGFLVTTSYEGLGEFKVTSNPLRSANLADKDSNAPAPSLGQHTDVVLKELGYSESDISNLRNEGVV